MKKKCARGKSNCHTDFETFHSHFQWALFLNAHGWNLNSPPRITWNNLNGYRPFVLSTDDLQWPNVTKFYYMTMTWKHITYDSIVENQHFLLCHTLNSDSFGFINFEAFEQMLQLLKMECTPTEHLIHKYSKKQAWIVVCKLLLLLLLYKLDMKNYSIHTIAMTIQYAIPIYNTNEKCHKKSFPMLH